MKPTLDATPPLVPIARNGAPGEAGLAGARAFPLAGSRHVWSERVRLPTGNGAQAFPISELPAADRQRLTGLRPNLCALGLDRPRVMGILNVTPDSFSDGGDHAGLEAAVSRARIMAREADVIDIGGESTRPGAEPVDLRSEIARTAPVIAAIRAEGIGTPISIDTRKARVAEAALEAGADMVNDVSALAYDPEMADLVASARVPVCLMHAQGSPETMQEDPRYGDVVEEVWRALAERIEFAHAKGITAENIVIDPGIGFGKTLAHNLALLGNLARFHALGPALLLGASRKRFIGTLGGAAEAKDRLGGSLSVALHAAAQGVQILRVHDTFATSQAMKLFMALNEHGIGQE